MIRIRHLTHAPKAETLQKVSCALKDVLKRKDLGFYQTPDREELWQSSLARAKELSARYDVMAFIGIGGSSLGPRVLNALSTSTKKIVFFENVDPFSFEQKFQDLNLEKTHWVIVSKSGSTLETLAQAQYAHQLLKREGIDLSQHATVITEQKQNPLSAWAREFSVKQLEIPVDVGGRFSVLTPVGFLPAAFLGLSLDKIKAGAQWALQSRQLIESLSAAALESFEREEWITAFWIYSDRLASFGLWLQQLWSESLAKAGGPRVSTPLSLVGTNDQHSVLQQLMEGANDKLTWFFEVEDLFVRGDKLISPIFPQMDWITDKSLGDIFKAETFATSEALEKQGKSVLCLSLQQVDEEVLGALFMLGELLIATLGECLQIDAFNQPGVELGKRLAKERLK